MRPLDPRYAALPLVGGEDVDARVDFVAVGRTQFIERYRSFWTTDTDASDGSPTRILERGEPVSLPPCFVSQGIADQAVSIETTREFVRLYRSAGG
jgi:hypothetical protein